MSYVILSNGNRRQRGKIEIACKVQSASDVGFHWALEKVWKDATSPKRQRGVTISRRCSVSMAHAPRAPLESRLLLVSLISLWSNAKATGRPYISTPVGPKSILGLTA